MGALESLLSALGLKQAALLAGLIGGGIGGAILPGPLSALGRIWQRLAIGAVCGAAIGGYCAGPLARYLGRPDDFNGIAFGLGLVGLAFAYKVAKTWAELDLAGVVRGFFANRNGGA